MTHPVSRLGPVPPDQCPACGGTEARTVTETIEGEPELECLNPECEVRWWPGRSGFLEPMFHVERADRELD